MTSTSRPAPPAPSTLYTSRELIADGCVHVIGVIASVIAVYAMMSIAIGQQDGMTITSVAIYGVGAIAVFVFSALYNMDLLPSRRAIMRRLDHAAIFIKIAGTYTPFAAISIGGGWGVGLLSAVWVIAAIGVPMQLFAPERLERLSVMLYLLQGWVVVFALEPLTVALSGDALFLLFIGGLLYTTGVLFHLAHRLPYHNAIWHAFVLAASACMYFAIFIDIAS